MPGLADHFVRARDDIELAELDIIEIGTCHISKDPEVMAACANEDIYNTDPAGFNNRSINFNYILQTGEIPMNSEDVSAEADYENHKIDWEADDSLIQAYDTIKEHTLGRIENSHELQELLAKPEWNYEDRVVWEREVSAIIDEELDNIEGLDQYRSAGTADEGAPPVDEITRPVHLNDLSRDIDNGTMTMEFDCEAMSVLQGAAMQEIENQLLPVDPALEESLKTQSSYFYTTGYVDFSSDNAFSVGGHAFTISSATGNVIEATYDPSRGQENELAAHYAKTYNMDSESMTFEGIMQGEIIIADSATYGLWMDMVDRLRADDVRHQNMGFDLDQNIKYAIDPEWRTGDIPEMPPEIQDLAILKHRIQSMHQELAQGNSEVSEPLKELKETYSDTVAEHMQSPHFQDIVDFLEQNATISESPNQAVTELYGGEPEADTLYPAELRDAGTQQEAETTPSLSGMAPF